MPRPFATRAPRCSPHRFAGTQQYERMMPRSELSRSHDSFPVMDDYRWLSGRRDEHSLHGAPLVSVVTACLNAAKTLERTIASVQAQTYSAVEHIVVDGGSTDGTVDILKQSLRPRDYWISEKDGGISDAFNRGIALSHG